jgi:predicted transcriptional regulator
MPRSPGTTRITADVPDEDVEKLDELAKGMHANKTTALVRALRTADLLRVAASEGSRIIIEDKDGTRREILMP